MKKDNKGVTLIEVIVVVAIMGVMVGALGYSWTMVSHQKVSNNALSIKQSIQLAQTYNKSQGNSDDIGAANDLIKYNSTMNTQQKIMIENQKVNAGLCKLKIVGPTDNEKSPYLYLGIAGTRDDLLNETTTGGGTYHIANGNNGKIKLEKKTKIKIYFKNGEGNEEEMILDKGDYADIYFKRTTGGFDSSTFHDDGATQSGIPTKITVSDGTREVILNLATYTGVVTKEVKK